MHTYHTLYADYTHYFFPHRGTGRALCAGFARRTLNRTTTVIATIDQSPVGFLVGALLSHELGTLKVKSRQGEVDFLGEINRRVSGERRLSVEGELCPACRHVYNQLLLRHDGDWTKMIEHIRVAVLGASLSDDHSVERIPMMQGKALELIKMCQVDSDE